MQDVYIIWDDSFAENVIQYLGRNSRKSEGIIKIDRVPSDIRVSSPSFIDRVEENLPENLPSCDVIIPIGVGMYLQSLPVLAEKTGAEASIVPIEDPGWYPSGILNQMKEKLGRRGVEVAYPRPFCSLEGRGRKSIEKFVEDYGIGKPVLNGYIENGKITRMDVETSAPCGSTHAVARRVEGAPASFKSSDILELEKRASKAWHSYPCTADMKEDPILKETILHRAGYLVRKAVKEAVELDLKPDDEEKESGTISEKCPELCGKCVETCEKSGTGVLRMKKNEIVIPDYERCTGCRSCLKVCPIDVTGKMVTKRDNLLLEKWSNEELAN